MHYVSAGHEKCAMMLQIRIVASELAGSWDAKSREIAAIQGFPLMPYTSIYMSPLPRRKNWLRTKRSVAPKPGTNVVVMFLQCEGCGHGLTAVVRNGYTAVAAWMNGTAAEPGNIAGTYPGLKAAPIAARCPGPRKFSVLIWIRQF